MGGADVYVLGINAYDHDVAACLLKNGEIVVAIAKERLTRVKHASGFYQEVVDYCLDEGRIPLDRVDLVVLNTYVLPVPELERRLLAAHHPYHLDRRERTAAREHPLFLSDADNVVTCSHHLAHAYSAFAVSPFDEGAVMVVDGVGSHRADVTESIPEDHDGHPCAREAESYYRFRGEEIETVLKVWMGPVKSIVNDEFEGMPGLGAMYSRVSTYVFGNWNKCGEVMGLAPYGRAGSPPLMELADGRLEIHEWPREHSHPFIDRGDDAWERSPHRRGWEDLTRRVQEDLENALVERANWLFERTGTENLCLAGGVALNCVANARLLAETPFTNLFVQPAATDDGVALGCALYGHLAVGRGKRTFVMRSAALGRAYREDEFRETARSVFATLTTAARRPADVLGETADRLARGEIVGWFTGRSEFGPRALGQRSILADPRDAAVKDRVNARVKHRQAFRPFAPAVLAERATEIFVGEEESPFMLLVKEVRPEKRHLVPAIVHVDGTARVQTVRREDDPRFHALISAFARRTGVPVLLNTSFNVRGEPIVETPRNALECFLTTRLDALVMEDWILTKRPPYRAIFPLVRFILKV
ncbi:MAG: carbamoyltransferase family protein, partial [Planctomycetota bacterium]